MNKIVSITLFLVVQSSSAFVYRMVRCSAFNCKTSKIVKRMYSCSEPYKEELLDELKKTKLVRDIFIGSTAGLGGYILAKLIFKTENKQPENKQVEFLKNKLKRTELKLKEVYSKLDSLNKIKSDEKTKLNSQISSLVQENSKIKILLDNINLNDKDIREKIRRLIEAVDISPNSLEVVKNELLNLEKQHNLAVQKFNEEQNQVNSEQLSESKNKRQTQNKSTSKKQKESLKKLA